MNDLKTYVLILIFGFLSLGGFVHGANTYSISNSTNPYISNIINLDPAFNAMTNPGIVFNQTTGLAYITDQDHSGTNLGGNIIVVNMVTDTIVNTIAISSNISSCGYTVPILGGEGSMVLVGKLLYFGLFANCIGAPAQVGIGAFDTQTDNIVMTYFYGEPNMCSKCGYASSMTYDSNGIGFGNVPSILFSPTTVDGFLQFDLTTNTVNTTTYAEVGYVSISPNDSSIYIANDSSNLTTLNFSNAYTRNAFKKYSVNSTNPIYVNPINNEVYYCDSNKNSSGLDIFNGTTGNSVGFIPMGYKCPTEGAAFVSSLNYLVVTTPNALYGNVSIIDLSTNKDIADVYNQSNYKYYKSAPTDLVINNKSDVAYVVDSLGNLTTLTLPPVSSNTTSTSTTTSSTSTSTSVSTTISGGGGDNTGGGGGGGGSGGSGSSKPIITNTTTGFTVNDVAPLNAFSLTLCGTGLNATENFVTPSSVGVTINGQSYTLPLSNSTQLSGFRSGCSVELMNISYLPIQHTATFIFTQPANTTTTVSTVTTVSTSAPTLNTTTIITVQPQIAPSNSSTIATSYNTSTTILPSPYSSSMPWYDQLWEAFLGLFRKM